MRLASANGVGKYQYILHLQNCANLLTATTEVSEHIRLVNVLPGVLRRKSVQLRQRGSVSQLAMANRQDGTSVEKHVSNCTLGGIRAVCVGGIGVAMQALYFRNFAKVITQSKMNSAFEIAQQVFESCPVNRTRVGHELAQFVHGEGNIRPGPVGDEVCESYEFAVLGAALRVRSFRAVLF